MKNSRDIHNDVPGQSEDALQQKCVFWFRNKYPELRGLLFSVPNGGLRDSKEALKMKMTGQVNGVSDLILLYSGKAYLIELKRDHENARQSVNQKHWQSKVEGQGFDYVIINSLELFKNHIKSIVK